MLTSTFFCKKEKEEEVAFKYRKANIYKGSKTYL